MEKNSKKKKKKKIEIAPKEGDLCTIYKEDISSKNQDKIYELFDNMIETFPFNINNANHKMYDDVYIDVLHKDDDNQKKKPNNEEEDNTGGFSRPEVDYPFEEDLTEHELIYKSSPLQLTGGKSNENYGELRYIIKVCKESETDEYKNKISKEFDEETERIKKINNEVFSVRIYVLNCSNLTCTSVGGSSPDSFIWIKRWEDDREIKDLTKIVLKTTNPEFMCVYNTKCIYPVYFFNFRIHSR